MKLLDPWFVLDCDGVDEEELDARLRQHGLCIVRDIEEDVVCIIKLGEQEPPR